MRGRRARVAIVDDDEAVRKSLARLLSAHRYEIETHASAEEFLTSFRKGKPECLLLDFHMPDVSGLELQHHMLRNGISTPTIVITAHNEPGLRERCEAAGAAAFLLKPLNGSTLVDTINDVVGAPKGPPGVT
jgi:FixJ family two-component response regulator